MSGDAKLPPTPSRAPDRKERADGDEITIRRAGMEDAAVIAAIYSESIAIGDSTMDEAPRSEEDVRAQMRGFNGREAYLVLERAGRVLGWGVLKRYSDRPGYRYAAETSVYLWRAEIGRGYGTRLKRALIKLARELEYRHLVAKVWASNTRSIAYNTRVGFELVGVQREIGYKRGRRIDVAILQCVLEDLPDER